MGSITSKVRDKTELRDLLSKHLEWIEKELKLVTSKKVKIAKGKEIDILAINEEGVLNVIELKVTEDDEQLMQATGYYDWVLGNIDFIKNSYPQHKISDSNPITPLLGVASCIFLMSGLPGVTSWRFIIWLMLGLMAYFFYGIRSSILHMAQ
jgi:hypothetical protein